MSARQKVALSLPLGGEARLSQVQFSGVGLRVKPDRGGALLATTQLLFFLFKNYLFFENVVHHVLLPNVPPHASSSSKDTVEAEGMM